jgi:hypothetical protein
MNQYSTGLLTLPFRAKLLREKSIMACMKILIT